MRPTHSETILRLAKRRSYFSLSDAAELGAPRVVLTRLVRGGQLERISRGLYRHPLAPMSEYDDLVKAAHHAGQGIFCLLTALRVHGIRSQLPFGVWLALPHRSKAPRVNFPRLHITRFSGLALSEGIEIHVINGFPVRVYGVAKTLADCFRFRDKIGLEVALDALRDAWINRHVSLDELLHYARICCVEKAMQPYLDSLIWIKRVPAQETNTVCVE